MQRTRPLPAAPARHSPPPGTRPPLRRGVFTVIAVVALFATLAFVALGVDLGMISLTQARMQFAVDAAALAAAQELSDTVAESVGGDDLDGAMADRARAMAVKVGDLNGTYVDDGSDVRFGKRVWDDGRGRYRIAWGAAPYNVVEVSARRENPDTSAPDGQLPAFFSRIFGMTGHTFRVKSIAYVEPRDLVLVLDYSASMNDDSELPAFARLGEAEVTANMLQIWDALGLDPDLLPTTQQRATVHGAARNNALKIPHITVTPEPFGATVTSTHNIDSLYVYDNGARRWKHYSNGGKTVNVATDGHRAENFYVKSWKNDDTFGRYGENFNLNHDTTRTALGLDGVDYPFPVGGWDEYFYYMRDYRSVYDAGQLMKYGKPSFVSYVLAFHPSHDDTPPLWKAPAQPFHAMKEGVSQLTEFLGELQYGDHLGLVSYDTTARREVRVDDPAEGIFVDITADPITDRYDDLDTIQRHRQAGYYQATTGLGDGVSEARAMLAEHGRYGARPTILVMTDGNANVSPPGWTLPDDWDWDELTDFDGDGVADYTTDDVHKQYAFYHSREAIDAGGTVHTMSVGAGADAGLMHAVAHAGGGIHIDVPGGSDADTNEELLREAFRKIAARVPPPRLLIDRDAE